MAAPFVMYGYGDADGNVVRGPDVERAYKNSRPGAIESGDEYWKRLQGLFAEAKRLQERDRGKYRAKAVHAETNRAPEPAPIEPPARWPNRHTTVRPMWRKG